VGVTEDVKEETEGGTVRLYIPIKSAIQLGKLAVNSIGENKCLWLPCSFHNTTIFG
jgi:hypothetical protein